MDKKGSDPFTSNREGIVDGDQDFAALLKYLKEEQAFPTIFERWDEMVFYAAKKATKRTRERPKNNEKHGTFIR